MDGVSGDTFPCWQEPEKVEMVGLWKEMFNSKVVLTSSPRAEIVVPSRDDKSFKESYPIEQYHSETY